MKFLEPRRNVFRIWLLFLLRNEMKEKIIHDDSVWCHGIQLMQAMCLFIFRDVVKSLSHRTQQVFVESISNILSTYSLTFTQKFVKLEFYFWLFSVRVCIHRHLKETFLFFVVVLNSLKWNRARSEYFLFYGHKQCWLCTPVKHSNDEAMNDVY